MRRKTSSGKNTTAATVCLESNQDVFRSGVMLHSIVQMKTCGGKG